MISYRIVITFFEIFSPSKPFFANKYISKDGSAKKWPANAVICEDTPMSLILVTKKPPIPYSDPAKATKRQHCSCLFFPY